MRRSFPILVLIGSAVLVAGAVGFLGAHIAGNSKSKPFVTLDRLGKRIGVMLQPASEPPADSKDQSQRHEYRFSSIFIPLDGKGVRVPVGERTGRGGGLTSFGDQVVLLRFDGSLFLVSNDLNVLPLGIQPPENGFSHYQEDAASEQFKDYRHAFRHFRFNDIEHFKTDIVEGLLASYTHYSHVDKCYTTRISRLVFDQPIQDISAVSASSDAWETLFDTAPCLPLKREWRAIEGHMAGARMVFDGHRGVYLASGDYSWDGIYGPRTVPGADPDNGPAVAQDPTADYGKVIYIDVEDGTHRQVSRGHRNTQGIALDRNGGLWVTEHGARGGDELNLVVEGRNYGWPLVSYGTLYSALPIPGLESNGGHDGYELPRLAWLPSIAVSGLARVEGFHETWDGDLIASTLRGNMLVRIRQDAGRVVFTEFIDVGKRIRYVLQHTMGRLVLWTDDGEVIFVSPGEGGLGRKYVDYRLATLKASEDEAARLRVAISACAECHSFNAGENDTAPSLANVFGSKTGSTGFVRYSQGMSNDGRVWTEETLSAFLSKPVAHIEGTNMPDPALDSVTVAHVVSILKGLKTDVEIPSKYREM